MQSIVCECWALDCPHHWGGECDSVEETVVVLRVDNLKQYRLCEDCADEAYFVGEVEIV